MVDFSGVRVYLYLDGDSPRSSGGTVGSVVDHVGFAVPDTQWSIDTSAAAEVPIELSERRADQAWIMTPDELRIEIL